MTPAGPGNFCRLMYPDSWLWSRMFLQIERPFQFDWIILWTNLPLMLPTSADASLNSRLHFCRFRSLERQLQCKLTLSFNHLKPTALQCGQTWRQTYWRPYWRQTDCRPKKPPILRIRRTLVCTFVVSWFWSMQTEWKTFSLSYL